MQTVSRGPTVSTVSLPWRRGWVLSRTDLELEPFTLAYALLMRHPSTSDLHERRLGDEREELQLHIPHPPSRRPSALSSPLSLSMMTGAGDEWGHGRDADMVANKIIGVAGGR